MDKVSKEVRSAIMSSIRGKDTKPEMMLRSALHKAGYRYSLRYRFKEIRCSPDIVMPGRRTVIFVDGCFWHGCKKCYKEPKSNRSYWVPKIQANIARDKRQTRYLRSKGWRVIRVKEHRLNAINVQSLKI